jgi:hypothetical protein
MKRDQGQHLLQDVAELKLQRGFLVDPDLLVPDCGRQNRIVEKSDAAQRPLLPGY